MKTGQKSLMRKKCVATIEKNLAVKLYFQLVLKFARLTSPSD